MTEQRGAATPGRAGESGGTSTGADATVRVDLEPDPRSVRTARRMVVDAVRGWRLDHLEDPAALLVSEVATNAVLHARSPFAVEVSRRRGVVRVEVSDRSPAGPQRRRHSASATTGRGLALVATLSTAWGTEAAARPWAKRVWFELPVEPALLPEPDEGALLA